MRTSQDDEDRPSKPIVRISVVSVPRREISSRLKATPANLDAREFTGSYSIGTLVNPIVDDDVVATAVAKAQSKLLERLEEFVARWLRVTGVVHRGQVFVSYRLYSSDAHVDAVPVLNRQRARFVERALVHAQRSTRRVDLPASEVDNAIVDMFGAWICARLELLLISHAGNPGNAERPASERVSSSPRQPRGPNRPHAWIPSLRGEPLRR